AWTFAGDGVRAPLTPRRLVFLLCLVAPFRGVAGPLAVVLALTLLQGVGLVAGAWGGAPDWRLMEPMFDVALAAATLWAAIENAIAPSLRRRWLIACVLGIVGGFGLGHVLAANAQFAGDHPLVATATFGTGTAFGELAALALIALILA